MWQHAQFGYLNPSSTLEGRVSRLREALNVDRLPISFIAISDDEKLVGSASILATTLTHKHLTPWLSSVFVPVDGELPIVPQKTPEPPVIAVIQLRRQICNPASSQSRTMRRVGVQSVDTREVPTWPELEPTS
jgi:hypothetical protein